LEKPFTELSKLEKYFLDWRGEKAKKWAKLKNFREKG
jgi:hypothetical protein